MAEIQPEIPKIQSLAKYSLFAKAPGVEGRNSQLVWSVREGNPRITVFTRVPNDTNKGVLTAAFDPETFKIFLDLFEAIIRKPDDDRNQCDCDTHVYDAQGNRGEKVLGAKVTFGKKDGIVWIGVTSNGRPQIKFDFKLSEYHRFYKNDGTQYTESEMSVLKALAVVRTLRDITTDWSSVFQQPRPNTDQAGSGRSNYSNRQNYSKDYKKPNTDTQGASTPTLDTLDLDDDVF